jgi:DNA-directed RNA polymerase subunit RPC12/RpoP
MLVLSGCARYAKARIDEYAKWGDITNASSLGFTAFPDNKFKMPQGAAFAVAKIKYRMEKDGLLILTSGRYGGDSCGYQATNKGVEWIISRLGKFTECPSCGHRVFEKEQLTCPHCENYKCEKCDMGDDVECASCPTEDDI